MVKMGEEEEEKSSMTEQEAREIVYALGTAMLLGDKELREFSYSHLSKADLKKVLRWTMRFNLQHYTQLVLAQGYDPLEVWRELALSNAEADEDQ